jgi:hypothetical protein
MTYRSRIWVVYVSSNSEVCSDLSILETSQFIIPFNPLWSYLLLLFTTGHIFYNVLVVIAVVVVVIIFYYYYYLLYFFEELFIYMIKLILFNTSIIYNPKSSPCGKTATFHNLISKYIHSLPTCQIPYS